MTSDATRGFTGRLTLGWPRESETFLDQNCSEISHFVSEEQDKYRTVQKTQEVRKQILDELYQKFPELQREYCKELREDLVRFISAVPPT